MWNNKMPWCDLHLDISQPQSPLHKFEVKLTQLAQVRAGKTHLIQFWRSSDGLHTHPSSHTFSVWQPNSNQTHLPLKDGMIKIPGKNMQTYAGTI